MDSKQLRRLRVSACSVLSLLAACLETLLCWDHLGGLKVWVRDVISFRNMPWDVPPYT